MLHTRSDESEPPELLNTAQLAISLLKVEQGGFFSESDPLLVPSSYGQQQRSRRARDDFASGVLHSAGTPPRASERATGQTDTKHVAVRSKKAKAHVDPKQFSASIRGLFEHPTRSSASMAAGRVGNKAIDEHRRPSTTIASLAKDDQQAKEQTTRQIEAAVALMPVAYILQQGLHHYLYVHRDSHGLRLFLALQRLQQRIALKCWYMRSLQLRERARNVAAIQIQKVARGWRGRTLCKQVSAARTAAERIEMMQQLEAEAAQRQAAIRIQKHIRGSLGRRYAGKVRAQYQLRQRAKRAWWDARLYVRVCFMFKSIGQDVQSAKLIQRWWRGAVARRHAADAKRLAHQRKRIQRLTRSEQAFKVYLQYEGAALTIQKWWQTLPYCRRHKRRCVRRIWKCYSSYHFRQHIARRSALKHHSARLIQAAWHRHVVVLAEQAAVSAHDKISVVDEAAETGELEATRPPMHSTRRAGVQMAISRLRYTARWLKRADAARKIQRWWKIAIRRKRSRRVAYRRKHRAAATIQQTWKTQRCMRARMRLATFINPRAKKRARRTLAASQLARWWRSVYYIHWFMAKRRKIINRLTLVQALGRGYFGRKRIGAIIQDRRCDVEFTLAGKTMLHQTRIYLKRTLINKLSRFSQGRVRHETQEVYDILTNNHRGYGLDVNRWVKFLKECPQIINRSFETSAAELLFTKVRDADEKKINYKQFVSLLEELGQAKYVETKRPRTSASAGRRGPRTPASRQRGRNEDNGSTAPAEEVSQFEHAPLRGMPALFVWVMETYIALSDTYSKAYQRLGQSNIDRVVDRKLVKAVRAIQHAYRSYRIRLERTRRLQEARLQAHTRERKESAIIIQAWARRYLARIVALQQAQEVYVKFYDEHEMKTYWCNSQTDHLTWTKPLLLGQHDCGEAVLAVPPEQSLVVYCDQCQSKRSIFVCDDCDANYCAACWSIAHSSRTTERHHRLPQDICVECRYQVITKACTHCAEGYCDCCYVQRHRKGAFRHHIAHATHPSCGQCREWAAQVVVTASDAVYNYCLTCYRVQYGLDATPRSQNTASIRHAFLKYVGPSLAKYRLTKEAAWRKAQIIEAERLRREQQYLRKRYWGATCIQRRWRGVLVRRQIKEFVHNRKEALAHWRSQNPIRAQLAYKLRAFAGVAPPLESDTPYERVLKQYPAWLHRTVRDAVQGAWLDAAALVDEQLAFQARPKPKAQEILRIVGAYIEARAGVMLSDWMVAHRTKQHDQRRQLFYHSRSTKGAKHHDTQRLKTATEQAVARLERANAMAVQRGEAYTQAHSRLTALRGPPSVKSLIKEKRSSGIELPFTVNVYQGWSFAEAPDEKWALKLRPGHRVQIGELCFTVVAASAPQVEHATYDQPLQHAGDMTARTARSRVTDATGDGTESMATGRGGELQHIVSQIDPRLKIPLNKIWPLASQQELPIARKIIEPMYSRVFTKTMELLSGSMPAQAVIHSVMRLLHNTSQRMLGAAALRDEEEALHRLLMRYAQRLQRWQQEVTKHSRTVIRPDLPSDLVLFIGAARAKFVDDCRVFAALVAKSFKRSSAVKHLSPFARWELSQDKEVVDVYWESGETSANQLLGQISIDLDAPADVLREKLRRELRGPLNQLRGESFLFALGSTSLSRLDEPKTSTRDLAPLQTDHKTFLASNQLVLLAEPDALVISIPVIEMEPELRAALESGAAALNDDDDDGEDEAPANT